MRLAISLPSSYLTGSWRQENYGLNKHLFQQIFTCQHFFEGGRGGGSGLTCFIFASSRLVCSSLRRSFLFPTSMMGTFGQKCFTSGVHFSGIFSASSGGKGCSHEQQSATLSHSTIMSGLIIKNSTTQNKTAYLNCQGCLQRSTWEWRQCPGKTGASACHSLPDLQYPKALALPGEGKGKFIISTD